MLQYAITVALSHKEIGKHPQRITKIEPFINKYYQKEINCSLEKDDWKKIKYLIIAFNILHIK